MSPITQGSASGPRKDTAGDGATVGPQRVELAGRNVSRVAFGAARLTAGDGWGVPEDISASRNLLRSAIDLGYDYIDTADSLGPGVSEAVIGDVVGNSDRVLVATKVGMLRPSATRWGVLGHPDYLRQQVRNSLLRLRRDRIDLVYLHRIDPAYPLADQLGALQELRDEGLVGHIGVSEPTPAQLEEVFDIETPAVVQSVYNLVERRNGEIITTLGDRGIPFVAYWPLLGRGVSRSVYDAIHRQLRPTAQRLGTTTHALSLAWIFGRHPLSLAVVGSRDPRHLAANRAAADLTLDDAVLDEITAAVDAVCDPSTAFNPARSKDDK